MPMVMDYLESLSTFTTRHTYTIRPDFPVLLRAALLNFSPMVISIMGLA